MVGTHDNMHTFKRSNRVLKYSFLLDKIFFGAVTSSKVPRGVVIISKGKKEERREHGDQEPNMYIPMMNDPQGLAFLVSA